MKRGLTHLRQLAGMAFGRECSLYYWCGWAALTTGALCLLYVEFSLRSPDHLSFYLVEAWLGLLAPFIVCSIADSISMGQYSRVWHELLRLGRAAAVVEQEGVGRVRAELARHPLLRWMRPPLSRDSRVQLLTAALWYTALTRPPGSGWWARYGEWVVDICCGYLPLGAAVAGVLWLPAQRGWLVSLGLAGAGLITLGLSAVRLAGRRQAILDYFTAWLSYTPDADGR